ncbi:MAG: MarR family winged helix-turn-helix transcriptional regulator [Rhodospirillaceae bacterium]
MPDSLPPNAYQDIVRSIERLHRRFLDLIRTQLRRDGISDVNAVQALLLHNIGGDDVVMRDLKDRGYYFGSNVSYNIRKLAEAGYISQERDPHDRRAIRLRITNKGLALCHRIALLQDRMADKLSDNGLSADILSAMAMDLRRIDRIWSAHITGRDAAP